MELLKCENCGKVLTIDMEVEYSSHCCKYFCNPNCATDFYYDYMMSNCVDFDNLKDNIVIKNNRLYKRN